MDSAIKQAYSVLSSWRRKPRLKRKFVNLLTMDGFDGGYDYSISLKNIYTIHRAYELKRQTIQIKQGGS